MGVCGNDVGVCGNDVGVCGNGVGVCGNGVGVCGNGGESNLPRPGRNPCRKRKLNRLGRRIDLKAKMAYNDATRVM